MKIKYLAIIWAVAVLAAAAAALLDAAPALADSPTNRAGLVVMHGSGQVLKMCVKFSEPEITGLQLLEKAGLELNVDPSNPVGVGVCSIQREGCTFPTQQCFCQCQGATCTYWSYWHLTGGVWKYSAMGTANSPVHNGDVDGWVWGAGTISSANPPPQATFREICPDPTATPTATTPPTNTPEPTPLPTLPVGRQATRTPEPTNTPPPTNTPGLTAGQLAQTPIVAGEVTATPSPTPGVAGQPTATWTPPATAVSGAASPTPANQPAAALPTATSVDAPEAAGAPIPSGPAQDVSQPADQPAQALGDASTAPLDASAGPATQPEAGQPDLAAEPTPMLLAQAASSTPRPRPTRDGPTATPILIARQSNTEASSAAAAAANASAPPAGGPGRGLLTAAGILLAGVIACGGTLFVIKRMS